MSTCHDVSVVEGWARSAAAGDSTALGHLFETFHDRLVRDLACQTRHNVDLAEDAAAAAWEKVARNIAGYVYRADSNGFEAWLFTIARRELAGHYRRTSTRVETVASDPVAPDTASREWGPAETLEYSLLVETLHAEVDSLPASQRECIRLRFIVGMDLEETARLMDKRVNAIKQLQLRALLSLRKRLGGTMGSYADSATRPGGRAPWPAAEMC